MKRKLILLSSLLAFSFCSFAQIAATESDRQNFDPEENLNNVVSVKKLIQDHQVATSSNYAEKHFEQVWKHRTYLNLNYVNGTLTPISEIINGKENPGVPTGIDRRTNSYKSSWGAALKNGSNARLHKKPIANIFQFNLDVNWIDLSVSHYEAEGNGKGIYSSEKLNEEHNNQNNYGTNKPCMFTPWNVEKYDINYGFTLGPSLTIAPFNYINNKGIHYVKFNIYYHIGYNISLLMMRCTPEGDVCYDAATASKSGNKTINVLDYGHGVCNTFGMNLSWKAIGFGYETKKSTFKFKSISEGYGNDAYKFKSLQSRIYLQFRF